MPAALPNVDLKGLGPTPEELAAARNILDDAKAASLGKKVGGDKVLRSRMASMTAYLKQYPDELVGESRGKHRQHYLLNFMVLQMRNSKAKKTTENIESSSHETKKMTDVNWWSSEILMLNSVLPKQQHGGLPTSCLLVQTASQAARSRS